jgi:hypothetical protein
MQNPTLEEVRMNQHARSAKRRAGMLAAAMAVAVLASAPLASADPANTERPFRGSCDTAITPQTAPGQIPIILAVDVVCRLTHLGLAAGGTDREVVVPAGPPSAEGVLPIYITIERITYVAADGDELWSTFAGPGELDLAAGLASFDGIETFVGGTGRFTGASGHARTWGEGSLASGTGRLTTSGTLRY